MSNGIGRRVSAAGAGALLVTLALAPGAATAAAGDLPTSTVMVNGYSGLCMEIGGWSTQTGAPAAQWTCNGGTNQRWSQFTGMPNEYSHKCLEVADWRTDNGAPVRQWDCTGGDNQQWSYSRVPGTDRWTVYNIHSAKCLEVADWRTDPGAPVRQWDCTGGASQQWNMPG
ncbi:RICIN domain-containing protein [Kitasatospora sp. NBC_01560]|uniref:RICIN domain-containing protein n=1 Tax=Kitasatospora sp. NBC_01560 TaxID=2975965 RepID=UPI00386D5A46